MRHRIERNPEFNITEVNQRYLKVFGNVTKVANLIQSTSNLPEIIEQYGDHPYSRVDNIVAQFLELSQESKKENGEVEFYYSETPQSTVLKSLPKSARDALKNFALININEFKNSQNTHLQNLAGVFSLYGIGVKQNGEEAVKYFEKSGLDQIKLARLSGNSKRLFDIGQCYEENVTNGADLSDDDEGSFSALSAAVSFSRKASNYFEASAELGYSQAQYMVGLENIKKDPDKAARFFTLAVAQGVVEASHALGNCYAHGIGVPKNILRAISFFESAADKQCAASQCELGKRYFKGDGVEEDHAKSLKYFISAIHNRNEEAVEILSKPTILSKLSGRMFFAIDRNSLITPLSKDEIVNIVDVMSKTQPTAERLQDSRSGFIGKLVEANQESLNLTDLFEINHILTHTVQKRGVNIFSACWSQEQKSLKMIHESMFKKVENFLQNEGVKKDYVADGKFNFEYSDELGISCKFSKPTANHGFSQVVPIMNPLDDAVNDRLKGFLNGEYQVASDNFFLLFNHANSERVTQGGMVVSSPAPVLDENPAASTTATTTSQLGRHYLVR